jgi:hypothetical protein
VWLSTQENRGWRTSIPTGFFKYSQRKWAGGSGPSAALAMGMAHPLEMAKKAATTMILGMK